MLEDATTYMPQDAADSGGKKAFDRFSDTDNVYNHIKSSCYDCIKG